MPVEKPKKHLAAILWFVAAGLAIVAAVISYLDDQGVNWTMAGGALFCLIMGLLAAKRGRQIPPAATDHS
jgi:hypothetical protein